MSENLNIAQEYKAILQTLPPAVQLTVVSKTQPAEKIKEIYDQGQRIFGENRVQELIEKFPLLPNDIQWHLIGHLQTNKVKYIAEFIDTIQSVDSEKLLTEIDRQAEKFNRKIKVLLQVRIAAEETKFGLEISEAKELFQEYLNGKFPNVEITGLMGMATFTDNENQVRQEFLFLKQLFDQLSKLRPLTTLSMGMSDDYMTAVECGSTSVRVGSAIFGRRN
ncbi:YggS family pyridoxal phosphate-dependent enzyme [Chryseobacterium sp.]|uniref:YggS family pyridoxal phosphate-dependent enzyme n=1 Tax=Chryseobacterium sp. TaxID=1871047 RepID=UPI0011CA8DE2|nr:YggS family pyridoxal phosphate-dependent enzyme [Chryseobacterium sp.]TXF79311.1 YggS family pyridoxal phosphate-dependent enzyme [Chryseobacterium sp.]